MLKNVKEKARIGSEPFSGTLLKLKKEINLPRDISKLLTKYYNEIYDYSFITLSDIHNALSRIIVVELKVTKFGKLIIGAKVINSTFSVKYIKSANILSKFILDDNDTTDIYLDQVQFFFKHIIHLQESSKIHYLAFVRWYKKADDNRSQFHCQIDKDDLNICNVELWGNKFYKLS